MNPARLHATLNWLLDAAADIDPTQSPDQVLERYLNRLLDWLDAQQGSVMLRQNDELTIVALHGLGAEVTRGMRVGLTDGPAGLAVVEGVPRLVQGPFPSHRTAPRPTSAMIVPIRARDRIIGVLNLGRVLDDRRFTDDDLQAAAVVTSQLAWMVSNARRMAKLWTLAVTDGLSGLYNRRYFLLRLVEEMQRSRRFDEPMCLVMIDLDGFKELNTRHGHLVGDEILAQVCGVLRRSLRAVDIASRYGGDEVSVILPKTSAASALALIERLQRIVADEIFLGGSGEPVKISFSAGIAQFPGDAGDPEALIREADMALLEAKRAGSSRVLLAE